MKAKMLNYLSNSSSTWKKAWILILLPFTFSCLDTDQENIDNTPTAYVSFFNGTRADNEIKIEVDDRVYDRKSFDFGQYIDYWYFYTGERDFSFKDPETQESVLDTTVNLEIEKVYSFFMTEDGSQVKTIFTEDSLKTPDTGKALIRLVHLSSDSPEVSVYQRDEDDPLIGDQSFMDITDFVAVDMGETDLFIRSNDNGEELSRINDIHLREGRIYTLIIRGKVQADSNSADALRLQLIRNYPNY
ncbi:DUF4397 domain-containing protein [Cyclobacterium plantarum]|uniref:DUF4397 domain-containing protein n=1 Tax=Cyclobacterium plantarum TaxID=2716263 RepID=A0ABX0H5G7_9BACT|nr:DUF4397 domain-containing protein [Cyclobacterium plantarum]NHE55579.1 DUF4397 domain-containing protein [Cyclobacterium plantarum]